MQIFNEDQVLDLAFRANVLKEIEGKENQDRKKESLRRYNIFRDKTKPYVLEQLRKQGFKPGTIAQMEPRAANISICKKIVKKKARTYGVGVDRTLPNDQEGTKAIQALSDYLGATQEFKKSDEYRQLSKNAALYVHPIVTGTTPDGKNIYGLTVRTLHSHQYDVIPDSQDHEIPRCFILSDFPAGNRQLGFHGTYSDSDGTRYAGGSTYSEARGDGVDQTIADSPSDSGAKDRAYVWWTKKYHFTTDSKGNFIQALTPENGSNPIKDIPLINVSMDQDGEFWAQGGEDVIDGSILINVLLTDTAAILNQQGWGQPVMTGQELKGEIVTGPHNVIELKVAEGSTVAPKYEIVSADPNTNNWIRLIELYLALMLTTNNLSPRSMQGSLESSSIASGLAKMIDESESTEDIGDAQGYYQLKEVDFWKIVAKWLDVYRETERLEPVLQAIKAFDGSKVNAKFKAQGIVLSEIEKVDLLQKRKDLGINSMVELIKMDDPSLSDEEAEKKLLAIVQEQIKIKLLSGESGDEGGENSEAEKPNLPAPKKEPKV